MTFKPSNYRKFIATAATATLVATAVVPAATANSSFTDVSENYKESVDYLYKNGIVNGITETQFGTQQDIKRVDVAVMIAKALLTDDEIKNAPASGFTDVPERAVNHVNALKAKGYVNGKSDTRFAASDSITRGEAAIMLANAYGISGDVDNVSFTDVADRYKGSVAALVDNDITQGKKNNRFGTDDAISRGELAIFLHKLETLEEVEFEVETVEAIDTTIDADAKEQFLSFTINGKEVSLEQLAEAGYEVEFKSTTSGIFKDKMTGELDMDKLSDDKSFKYQVVITKDDNAIESNLATVKVEKFESVIVSLDKYKLEKEDVALTKNVLVRGEKAKVTEVKGTSKRGGEVSFEDKELTFESSDKTKLLVNANGEITTVSAGDAKVIVKVKDTDVSLEIPVTVAAEERKANKVTTPKQEIGVVVGGNLEVPLTVTDQYGEPFAGLSVDDFGVQNDEEEKIANVTVKAVEAKKGLYKATVAATENAGTGELAIKIDDKTFLSLPLTVDADTEVATRKMELADSTKDQKVDLNPLAEDETIEFVFNQYNAAGIFIGKEENVGTESGTFKVSANNENVEVEIVDGVINVIGKKAGSAIITVMEGDIKQGEVTVTVEDTTPSIKAVTFAGDKLTKTPAQLDEILTVDGIELTASEAVKIDYQDDETILFLDVEGEDTKANQYDEGKDILLGIVDVVSSDIADVSISQDGEIQSGKESLKTGAKGTIALRITANGTAVAVQTINVDIAEEVTGENPTNENTVDEE